MALSLAFVGMYVQKHSQGSRVSPQKGAKLQDEAEQYFEQQQPDI